MNNYSMMSSERSVPCTQAEFDEIKALLDANEQAEDTQCCGIGCEFDEHEGIYLYGDEYADLAYLPATVCEKVGALLVKANVKWLEFGLAFYGDRPKADCCGGTKVRLLQTGELVDQVVTWPERAA